MNKGATFEAEGDKALKAKTFFGFASSTRFEDAGEQYTKAGNAYRLSDQFSESGDAYIKAAEALHETDSPSDYVNAYVEAGNSYKKVDAEKAIQAFNSAISAYCESGRIGQGARYMKEVAEVFEGDNNKEGAAKAFEQAAELYHKDSKKSNANTCMLKVATIVAELDQLTKAAGIYEQLGKDSLETKLGSFSAKGHFFSCLLCLLAFGDNVSVKMKLNDFKNCDFSFPTCRECQMIEKLVEATTNFDADAFALACSEHDRITPLDHWKTSMLVKAKRHVSAAAGEGEDGEADLC